MGMVFAPAAAKIVQFIKEIGVEINKALGPSERWGKTLGEGIGEFLKNAEPIKKFFVDLMPIVANFISNMAKEFKKLGSLWGDRGKFFEEIKSMFAQVSAYAEPALIRIEEQMMKIFSGLSGGILGVLGVATDTIKTIIITLLDTLYAAFNQIKRELDNQIALIPGTPQAAIKNQENVQRRGTEMLNASVRGGMLAGLVDKDVGERTIANNNENLAMIIDAMWKGNMPGYAYDKSAFDNIGVNIADGMERFFAGSEAAINASGDSDWASSLGWRKFKSDETLKGQMASNPTDVKDPSKGLLGSLTSELGRLATNVQSIFAEAKIKPIALAPKSEMEKEMEKNIEDEKKKLKKLKSGGKSSEVDFTSTDSLWQKMQSALNPRGEDKAIAKQEEQIKIMTKQLEEAKESRAKIGQIGVNVGETIGRFLGYAQ
jgi:hypothetical protein